MSNESSRGPTRKITDGEILDILKEADSPVLKKTDIAERDDVPIGQRQVENRLNSLKTQELVGSKIVTANPEARLWWHKGVEMKQAWPSGDEITEEIGVEAVDVLDIPGRKETLRNRRRAVDAVFKYLFDEESTVASELRLVGWGAGMDTYDSPEGLWNNCLNPALDESYFFQLHESEKEWHLSELGLWLKDRDVRGLWNDWEIHKNEINSRYHQEVQSSITSGDEVEIIDSRTSRVHYRVNNPHFDFDYTLATVLEMEEEVWASKKGTLSFTILVLDDEERLKEILSEKEQKSSNLEFDVIWRDNIDAHSNISINRLRDIELDVSDVFREINSDEPSRQVQQLQRWVKETQSEMIHIFN